MVGLVSDLSSNSVQISCFFAGGPVLPVQVEVAGWPQSNCLQEHVSLSDSVPPSVTSAA